MPTRRTQQHRSDLDLIARAVEGEAAGIVQTVDGRAVDRWWSSRSDELVDLVADGHDLTARSGAQYLTRSAGDAGVTLTPLVVRPDREQIAESLKVTGPVAFKKNFARFGDIDIARATMLRTLKGSVDRLTLQGARRTVMETVAAADQIIGYRRVAQTGACDFCKMLERRGAVYKTAGRAGSVTGRGGRPRGTQRVGASYHDHCRCLVEPIYGAEAELSAPPVVSADAQRRADQRVQARADRLRRRERIQAAKLSAREAAQANALGAGRAAATGGGRIDPDLLARWGVTEEQFLQARAVAKQVKADIRAVAKKEADNLSSWLDDRDLGQLSRPDRLRRGTDIFGGTRSRRDQAGYDFLEGLDDAELAQVRRRFVDSQSHPPDVIADQVRRVTNLDLTDDEALDWVVERWLHADGLRSVASGRLPRYADADNLLPADYGLEGYRLDLLFGVDVDEAAGHVAQIQANAARDFAERALGQPRNGPPPWEMDTADYLRELEDVESILASTVIEQGVDPGSDYRWAQARIRELAPPDIDVEGNMNPLELHEAIRITAITAGRTVA